jgi:hypothetical protein
VSIRVDRVERTRAEDRGEGGSGGDVEVCLFQLGGLREYVGSPNGIVWKISVQDRKAPFAV